MTDRIGLNADGTLDEIVAGGAHLENLASNYWFLSMRRSDGSSVSVWLQAKGKIVATWDEQGGAPMTPLVARLRIRAGDFAVAAPAISAELNEAADEIERLLDALSEFGASVRLSTSIREARRHADKLAPRATA